MQHSRARKDLDQNDQEYLRMRKQDFIDSVRNELDFSSVELEILKSNFNEFEKMLTENETINEDMFKLLKKLEEKNIYQEYRIYDLVQNMQNEKENRTYCVYNYNYQEVLRPIK